MIEIDDIKHRYSSEVALLILLLRMYLGKANVAEVNGFICGNDINWLRFQKIVRYHQLFPMVHSVITNNPVQVDEKFKEILRKKSLVIARKNLAKLTEINNLKAVFERNAIDFVVYKGIALSKLLNDDYISRETADIDLFIRSADFSKVYSLLKNEGYKECYYYNPKFEKQFLHSEPELLFRKENAETILNIEVHWSVTSRMMNSPIPSELLFSGTEKIDVGGHKVKVFNLHNHLRILLIHHGVNDVWTSLRHCMDIAILSQKYDRDIDWDKLKADAIASKVHNTANYGFFIIKALFGINIPSQFNEGKPPPQVLMKELLGFSDKGKQKLKLRNIKRQVVLRDSMMDKLRLAGYYLEAAISPNSRDFEFVMLPPQLYFIYYLIKPFRILIQRAT
jgi:hypothetical protein